MIPFILATVGGFFVGSALKEKKLFSEGGSVEESNNIMLKNKAKEIKHHSEELSDSIKDDTRVDAWVVAKAQRSATDLSDITHYLDGQKMANGGLIKVKKSEIISLSKDVKYDYKIMKEFEEELENENLSDREKEIILEEKLPEIKRRLNFNSNKLLYLVKQYYFQNDGKGSIDKQTSEILNDLGYNVFAKGGEVYNFIGVTYNDNGDVDSRESFKIKASSRNSAYEKAKKKYPNHLVELQSVDY